MSKIGIYPNPSITDPNKPFLLRKVDTNIAKARFIEMYKETGSIKISCQVLGIVYRNIWAWKETDPDFKKAVDSCKDYHLGILEDEAIRRAVYGVQKPVYQGGKLVGAVTEYSDSLLQTLLKGAAPDKYGNRVELTGANGGPIQNKVVHVHSNVPLAESEDDVQKTIDLSERDYSVIPNTNILTKEDYDLLGDL